MFPTSWSSWGAGKLGPERAQFPWNNNARQGRKNRWLIQLQHTHRIHGDVYINANIWGILMVNVTIYSIHGSYGIDQHGATDPRRKLAPCRSMSCTMRSHCSLRIWTFTCWYIVSFWEFFRPAPRLLTKVDSPQGLTLKSQEIIGWPTCCVRNG